MLTRREVAELLEMDACIEAVERAFQQHADGRADAPGVLATHVEGGGFHVKTAAIGFGRRYYAAKVNANFPDNRIRFGRPTIQGVLALFDAQCGTVLALVDSMEITSLRTAAATAVAAKYLAATDAAVVTVCGCGVQGRAQLRALTRVRPVRLAFAIDEEPERATAYAWEMARELGIEVRPSSDLLDAVMRSDVCVTCTTASRPLLDRNQLPPGIFVAAVGADHPEKQELTPALLAESTVVVDILEQCARMGDLHHAIAAGLMRPDGVHAELGQIVAGLKPGRRHAGEIIIFDSTGTALQDVAAAAVVYEQAVRVGRGRVIHLGS